MAYYKRVIGDLVYLSPISTDDTETFMRWVNDPEMAQFTTFHDRIISLPIEKDAIESLAKSGNAFSIIVQDTGRVIGNCSFHNVDNTNRNAEIGIIIGEKDYWGKGYGTEAVKLLLKFGFENRNFNSIHLHVFSFNERAISCYEKVGFKRQGIMREAVIRGNKKHDLIYMDFLASEYFAKG